MYEATEPLSVRDTAKGIAVRASLLGVVGLIVGAWVFGVAVKTASALVKVAVGLLVVTIGAGMATYQVKKFQRER